MGALAELVAGWAPEPVELTDTVEAGVLAAFAGAIDAPAPAGGSVPPLWHWFAFLERPARAELGADGHPSAGRFLPPIPDRRRMFAGGRLEVRAPLRVGEPVVRYSQLAAVVAKVGRSGEMLFVTVRHEFRALGRAGGDSAADDMLVVEEQDLVYRSGRPAATRAADPQPARVPGDGPWRVVLHPDEPLLFRVSALTYNSHRIHYDQAYAREVEGYPGLVVHGPLLALLLLELPRRHAPGMRVQRFAYRLDRPAFVGVPVVARRQGGELLAGVPGRPPSARGTVEGG